MTSFLPVTQQGDCEGTLSCWWTQNDLLVDFCIALCAKEGTGVSLNLTMGEAKQLYHVLSQELKGAEYYDE